MVKIIKKISLAVIILIIALSIKVYASELIIESPESIDIEKENTLEFTLKGKFDKEINSVKVNYVLPEGAEFKEFQPSGNWNLQIGGTSKVETEDGLVDAKGLIVRIDEGNVTGDVEFGKFIFNVPSTYSKENISLQLSGLDGTNTNCDAIDFSVDKLEKSVKINFKEDSNPVNPGESGNQENGTNQENSNINGSYANNSGLNSKDPKQDDTVVKESFGQYGGSKVLIILVGIVLVFAFVVYRKMKKVKFIK